MTDPTEADITQASQLIDVYLTDAEIKTLIYKLNDGQRKVPRTLLERIELSLRTGLER